MSLRKVSLLYSPECPGTQLQLPMCCNISMYYYTCWFEFWLRSKRLIFKYIVPKQLESYRRNTQFMLHFTILKNWFTRCSLNYALHLNIKIETFTKTWNKLLISRLSRKGLGLNSDSIKCVFFSEVTFI